MHGFPRVSLLLPLSLLLLGCGKGYQIAPVSGRVLMNGRPLVNVEVRFRPTGGKDLPHSIGSTDEQGNYTLHLGDVRNTPGAVVGEHRVEISFNFLRGRPGMTDRAQLPKNPREMRKGKSNRSWTLTCTVPADGKSDANFDLKSK